LRAEAMENFEFVSAFLERTPRGSVTPVGSERLTPNGSSKADTPENVDYVGSFLNDKDEANAKFANPLYVSRGVRLS